MEFKKIQFKSTESQRVYENYLKQIQSATKELDKENQNDILMELNSHIYESMSKIGDESNEVENIVNTLDKIGNPKEVLKPLIAEKKLSQATKTFNPVHVFRALILNFSYGAIYFFFFILYLFIFSFVLLIIGKVIYPDYVGLFYKEGEFLHYGGVFKYGEFQQYEILGGWFIPVTILIGIIFYFLLTLLLRLKNSLGKKRSDM